MNKPMREQLHLLRFFFVGYWRDWNPLEGYTPPKGKVCELRSLPGNIVTWASSVEQAHRKMFDALELAFKHAGGPVEWYEKASREMSSEDEQERQKLWERAWREAKKATSPRDVEAYEETVALATALERKVRLEVYDFVEGEPEAKAQEELEHAPCAG